MRSGKIKILTENERVFDVVKKVKSYEGVSDVTVEADLLTYYIDEWASDYDIMVSVMNALEEAGIDSDKFSGCAFGLGLDRMVMMKMGFNDIRDLNSGNLKIFKQFKVER
jgi:hypothetical protein